VIQFPRPMAGEAAEQDRPEPSQSGHLAPVVNIRLEPKREVSTWKWAGVAALLGVVAFSIVADVAWQANSRPRADVSRGYKGYLQLNANDDYKTTIRKLGRPTTNRALIERGRRMFRALTYAQRQYAVILMGAAPPYGEREGQNDGRYIGALDSHGRVLDSVKLPDGSSSEPLLHSLASF
jgi:hypothetical protein